jgi:hypothetical protein
MSNIRRERQQERIAQMKAERIANVDLLWFSPQERAERVWALLQAGCEALGEPLPPRWDLACFNAEALGKLALGLADAELTERVRDTLRWIYTAHYNHPRDILGPPDKVQPGDADAIQQEQEHDHSEREIPSGHARGEADDHVAERQPEATGVQDSGSSVGDSVP